jgi:hypothetical protein
MDSLLEQRRLRDPPEAPPEDECAVKAMDIVLMSPSTKARSGSAAPRLDRQHDRDHLRPSAVPQLPATLCGTRDNHKQ